MVVISKRDMFLDFENILKRRKGRKSHIIFKGLYDLFPKRDEFLNFEKGRVFRSRKGAKKAKRTKNLFFMFSKISEFSEVFVIKKTY